MPTAAKESIRGVKFLPKKTGPGKGGVRLVGGVAVRSSRTLHYALTISPPLTNETNEPVQHFTRLNRNVSQVMICLLFFTTLPSIKEIQKGHSSEELVDSEPMTRARHGFLEPYFLRKLLNPNFL